MQELNLQEIENVSGATAIEACLAVGGAAALAGSFLSPLGTAIGGFGGCALGFAIYMM